MFVPNTNDQEEMCAFGFEVTTSNQCSGPGFFLLQKKESTTCPWTQTVDLAPFVRALEKS
jgi:hypothetical protein